MAKQRPIEIPKDPKFPSKKIASVKTTKKIKKT